VTSAGPLLATRVIDPVQLLYERLRVFTEGASRAPWSVRRRWASAIELKDPTISNITVEIACGPGFESRIEAWRIANPSVTLRTKSLAGLGVRLLGDCPPPILALCLENDTSSLDLLPLLVAEAKGRSAVVLSFPENNVTAAKICRELENVAARVLVSEPSSQDVQDLLKQTNTPEYKTAADILSRSAEIEAVIPLFQDDLHAERERLTAFISSLNGRLADSQTSDLGSGGLRVSAEDVLRKLQESHTEFMTALRKMNSASDWGLLGPRASADPRWTNSQVLEAKLASISWQDTDVEEIGEPKLRTIKERVEKAITALARSMPLTHLRPLGFEWNDELRKQLLSSTDWLQRVHGIQVKLPFWPVNLERLSKIAEAELETQESSIGVPDRPTTFLGIARRITMQFAPITTMIVSPLLFLVALLIKSGSSWQTAGRFISIAFIAWGIITALIRWKPEREFNQKRTLQELQDALRNKIRRELKQTSELVLTALEEHLKRQREEVKRALEGMLQRMQAASQAKLLAERQSLQARKSGLEASAKALQELLSQCNALLRDLPSLSGAVKQRLQPIKPISGMRRP
jgi:hypothetical protein